MFLMYWNAVFGYGEISFRGCATAPVDAAWTVLASSACLEEAVCRGFCFLAMFVHCKLGSDGIARPSTDGHIGKTD